MQNRIHTIEEAKAVWKKFDNDFKALSEKLALKPKANATSKTVVSEPSTLQEELVLVELSDKDSAEFRHFIGSEKAIRISTNQTKLALLEGALKSANWNHDIFKDETLAYLALALFKDNKIQINTLTTILDRIHINQDFPLIETYSILDTQGNFTAKAKKILLPLIFNKQQGKKIVLKTDEQLEEFRLLVATLPKSEQIFYTSQKIEYDPLALGMVFINNGTLLANDSEFIHLSSSVFDARNIARFGLEEYKRPLRRLGHTIRERAESGKKNKAHYSVTLFPGAKLPYNKNNLHGHTGITFLVAWTHDQYHSTVFSFVPNCFVAASLTMVEITRENTGHDWSKEIWDKIDLDEQYLFVKNKCSKDYEEEKKFSSPLTRRIKMTRIFCRMLTMGNGTSLYPSIGGYLLQRGDLTPMGVCTFIDMATHPEKWRNFNIELDYLLKPYADYYVVAKALLPYIKKDTSKIRMLKFLVYNKLRETGIEASFENLNKLINEMANVLEARLAFKKLTKEDIEQLTHNKKPAPYGHDLEFGHSLNKLSNSLYFSLDNIPLNNLTMLDFIDRINHGLTENFTFHGMEKDPLKAAVAVCKTPELEAFLKTARQRSADNEQVFRESTAQRLLEEVESQYWSSITYVNFAFQGVSVDYLLSLSEADRKLLLNSFNRKTIDLVLKQDLGVKYFLDLETSLRDFLINDCNQFETLKKLGLSIQNIFSMEASLREWVIQNTSVVQELIKKSYSIEYILKLDPIIKDLLSKNIYEILGILKKANISLDELFKFNSTCVETLIMQWNIIEDIIDKTTSKISIQDLLVLNPEVLNHLFLKAEHSNIFIYLTFHKADFSEIIRLSIPEIDERFKIVAEQMHREREEEIKQEEEQIKKEEEERKIAEEALKKQQEIENAANPRRLFEQRMRNRRLLMNKKQEQQDSGQSVPVNSKRSPG